MMQQLNRFQSALQFVDERKQLQAYEELAILYEHKVKDYEKAMQILNKGYECTICKVNYIKTEQTNQND